MATATLTAASFAFFLLCSPILAAENRDDLSQVRLAYAGSTGMYVSWNTPERLDKPRVLWGTSYDSLTNIATSDESVTYPTSTTYNNHVKIVGLQPDTEYFYLPIDSALPQPFSFRTSRVAGDHTPFTAAVVVDLGPMGPLGLSDRVGNGSANPLKPGETNTIQALWETKANWDFLWHAGDIAYADYWLKETIQNYLPNTTTLSGGSRVYEKILNAFYNEMAAISGTKPYMVGPGNHEANCDNGGYTDDVHHIHYNVSICLEGQRNFTGYRNHFRMPSAESGGVGNFWYSFDHGMAHFVQLNTETDLGHGYVSPDQPGGPEKEDAGPFASYPNEQTDWLKKDLSAVDRTETPWIIVAGHRPWYISVSNDSSDVCWVCKDVFEPIFLDYSVDLVLSGHVHAYERNAPISDNKPDPAELNNPKAPWYITNGAAGHYDGLDTLNQPRQKYSRFAIDTTYGWSKLDFHNATHLTHEFVASGTGEVLDSATLYKNR